jgi:N-glycosylase/DNA lyase
MRLDVPFDLDFTLCCGQVFRWRKIDGWRYSVIAGNPLKIRQCGAELEFKGVDDKFVTHYFGLNDDLAQIRCCVDRDAYIHKALRSFEGLRLVRQDPWECLISYICATFKSIPAIEQMLLKLSVKFGEKQVFEGQDLYAFPAPEKLAHANLKDLRDCSLGYRAKYVQGTARQVLEGQVDFECLKKLPYLGARTALVEFPGIGLKVADCVSLFSLEKMEAFPVDVWVRRIIMNHYANLLPEDLAKKIASQATLSNGQYERLNAWGREYFGRYAGYAQEYLFHFERTRR